jgi:hypothetical protein
MRPHWTLLLLVAGCGGGSAAPAQSTGAATVGFAAQPLPSGPLTLDGATLELEDLSLFGDVQAAPGFMLPDVSVNVLAPSTPLRMDGLPQGVYSRLRFSVESLQTTGHWRDRSLVVDLVDRDDDDDVVADLRAPAGRELTAGQTVSFSVTIDVAGWFAGIDLDQADVDDDRIRLGGGHNGALVQSLLAALPGSFQLTTPDQ